jgi:hypothetical protein
MIYSTMIKDMLDFQKKVFDGNFNALQEQADQMLEMVQKQAAFFPEEGREALENWIGMYKTGVGEFRQTMEGRFKIFEHYCLTAAERMEPSSAEDGRQAKAATSGGNIQEKNPAPQRKRKAPLRTRQKKTTLK